MPTHHFKNSSMVSHCEHEGDCLTVTFTKGGKYKYYGVPTEVFHRFTKAESAGGHFLQHIKGRFRHEKVEE